LDSEKQLKTKTIKKRAIYVYLPSLEMTEEWKRRAEEKETSISKFVIERVEESLSREDEDDRYQSRVELLTQVKNAEDELRELRQENRLLRKLLDNQETELKRYRSQPFLEEDFKGVREFDKDLIGVLKRGGAHLDDSILSELNVKTTDVDLVKAIRIELDALERYGLVEFTVKGWKWIG
jgi:hypothetical protein